MTTMTATEKIREQDAQIELDRRNAEAAAEVDRLKARAAELAGPELAKAAWDDDAQLRSSYGGDFERFAGDRRRLFAEGATGDARCDADLAVAACQVRGTTGEERAAKVRQVFNGSGRLMKFFRSADALESVLESWCAGAS